MENKINIGELDTLVSVFSCEIIRGEKGQATPVFTKHSDVFAKVDRDVSEMVADGNYEEGQYIRLSIYKIGGLTTRWRIVIAGTPYAITAIDPVSRVSPLCVLTIKSIEGWQA